MIGKSIVIKSIQFREDSSPRKKYKDRPNNPNQSNFNLTPASSKNHQSNQDQVTKNILRIAQANVRKRVKSYEETIITQK